MSSDQSTPPVDEGSNLKVGKPKSWAAGNPAVISSMKHIMSTAGPVRGTKAMLELNQFEGFDCPSCAWPDPDDHRAPTEFCENGAKAIASETTSKRIDDAFFRKYSVEDLLKKSDYWHDQQGRLTRPMVRLNGASHYEPISWDDVFAILGNELRSLPTPDDGIFYTSGRASNEAAFMYQLFAKHFGTNNLPDCSNMCHESSGTALGQAIGIGKGTVSLDDIHNADTVICVGQNPGTNHPRMLGSLEVCVENGGKIVAINPLKEAGLMGFAHPQKVMGMLNKATPLASTYLQVKINGDMAIFRGIAKHLFERDASQSVIDHGFIAEHCLGFEDYQAEVANTSWDEIEKLSGISKDELSELTDTVLRRDKRLITCWAMGITQQKNAVATIREITNVHLMLGALGRPGAGVCPVRGHSNVQGDRTMGIYEKPKEPFLAAIDEVFDITCPREHGYDTVEAIQAMLDEPGKVFVALGGNFLQAAPDTPTTAKALENCKVTCHIATKLNRSHLITGETGLILPCLGRSEQDLQSKGAQFVTCENSMGVVHMSTGKLTPASEELLSEPMIVARLAEAAVGNTARARWTWMASDYDRIRDAIEACIPGFDNFNERVRTPGGFYLPNGPKERIWNTSTGKANFGIHPLSAFTVDKGRLALQTLRSHDQYNTTIYGLHDRYRGIGSERMVIFMNPEDMSDRNIKPTQKVKITSHWEDGERHAEGFHAIPYDMPRGAAAAYFPEANGLIPLHSTALESNTPTSKGIEVSVKGI